MAQNTTHAVMQQRTEARDSLDDFPTPPWATRALMEHVIMPEMATAPEIARMKLRKAIVWEPAANRGHMVRPLKEYFGTVLASDIHDYGAGMQAQDFLSGPVPSLSIDFIITNPPFRLARQFISRSLDVLGWQGTAVLVRSAFLEGIGRYNSLFKTRPPSIVAQFVERVPMVKGRLTVTGSTATSYCWLVWKREDPWNCTRLIWIPPCRRKLEKEGDYG